MRKATTNDSTRTGINPDGPPRPPLPENEQLDQASVESQGMGGPRGNHARAGANQV
jgi:hypothetical protein